MPQKKSESRVETEFDNETEEPTLNEEIFKRSDFAKTLSSLVGQKVKVKTRQGNILDGYLTEFLPETGLVLARRKTDGRFENDALINLKPADIASVSCVNINVEEAALNLTRQRFDGYDGFSNCADKNGNGFWEDEQVGGKWNGELPETQRIRLGLEQQKDNSGADGENAVDRATETGVCGGNSPNEERISTLNPYAEPFVPCGIADCNSSVNVPYVDVLPNKLTDESEETVDDFIAPRMRNRYFNEQTDDGLLTSLSTDSTMCPAEGKMYHPEKSQYPLYHMAPQDCQQYYPQLQYIQYFRRFY